VTTLPAHPERYSRFTTTVRVLASGSAKLMKPGLCNHFLGVLNPHALALVMSDKGIEEDGVGVDRDWAVCGGGERRGGEWDGGGMRHSMSTLLAI